MKVEKVSFLVGIERGKRPTCPRCGAFLKPTEISDLRLLGRAICPCGAKLERRKK